MSENLDGQDNSAGGHGAPPFPAHLAPLMAAGRALYASVDACDAAIATALGVNRSDLAAMNLMEDGPLSPSEIGRRLTLTSGSVTALIDRLERGGFVERVRSPDDRRSVRVALAADPYARTATLYRGVARAIADRFADVPEEDVTRTADGLTRFAEAFAAAAEHIRSASRS